ncbi:glycosyltransferase family 2 protein [Rhodococcoides kyotonense]|uniref:Glycosyl transferase family 2 n=1 Tax=Rhodococcoides kyotonense TaxID=398843 RepID=A0A239MD97_9NOCA|nr:glycosyltransferase family 2 protein [Rhodococcus kyotonensis]SNT40705.1 Glycosyl transferase family 2 [Rhodococcus kyotonensis]
MTEPTLSVVTISYRDPIGLARTLQSVAEQTYPSIEHIVIDGGSGDDVVEMLTEASPSYWHSRPDGGRYDAMNQGIARASGDVVWLMHSGDCFADADSAGIGVRGLGSGIRDRWGYGQVRIVGDPSRDGKVWGYSPFDMDGFALGVRPIPHQAALFGVDLLGRLGEYDTDFGLAADHLFMLRAATVEQPLVIDHVLCDFDASGAGSTRPQREHFADVRRAWDVAEYYPLGRRSRAVAYSRVLQASAKAKHLVRTRLFRGVHA